MIGWLMNTELDIILKKNVLVNGVTILEFAVGNQVKPRKRQAAIPVCQTKF